MKPTKKPKSDAPGINVDAILRDRGRTSAKHYTCACGGYVSCVKTSAFAETFECVKCKDVVAVLHTEQPKLPDYYGDGPDKPSPADRAWREGDYGKDEHAGVFDL